MQRLFCKIAYGDEELKEPTAVPLSWWERNPENGPAPAPRSEEHASGPLPGTGNATRSTLAFPDP